MATVSPLALLRSFFTLTVRQLPLGKPWSPRIVLLLPSFPVLPPEPESHVTPQLLAHEKTVLGVRGWAGLGCCDWRRDGVKKLLPGLRRPLCRLPFYMCLFSASHRVC